MKSVLWARIDSISNSYITYAIALLIVNILALYPDLYKGVLDDVVDVTRNRIISICEELKRSQHHNNVY